MNDDEQRRVFGMNLSYYIARSGKQQKEIAKDLGFPVTTFNTWCRGKIMPKMGKVQAIADYFGIEKTDLVDKHDFDECKNSDTSEGPVQTFAHPKSYYENDDTRKITQKVFDDPNLRVLFDAASDATPEDVLTAAELLRKFKDARRD